VNGIQASPTVPFVDLPREDADRSKPPGGTSAAQSRRAKNAAHRADDVGEYQILLCLPGPWVHALNCATTEFAFEIGSGLLTEVRRLQSLLAERDKAIQDMKEEKDDLEKSVEGLRTGLRQQEQNAGQPPTTAR
jgi:phage shock protein A